MIGNGNEIGSNMILLSLSVRNPIIFVQPLIHLAPHAQYFTSSIFAP